MKDFLKMLIKGKEDRIAQIRYAIQTSNDVNEVRSLTTEAETLQVELREAQAQLAAIEAEEAKKAQASVEPEQRSAVPANAQLVNGQVAASFGQPSAQKRDNEDPLASMDYRSAYKPVVENGTVIPAERRAGQAISTVETGAAIPLTIMNEVITTVRKRYGNLYNKVRKMNVQGGDEFPIGALQESFKWITESTVSPRQKTGKLGKVSFNYYTAEIRIAQTFLSNLLTIDAFENKITEVIAVAYVQAMDSAIVAGTGNGQPTGILNDARVAATGNTVSMTAAQISSWTEWRKRFFSKLPLGYRAGEFIFPLSTVEAYLETMADANNNPIFRQATGLEVNDGDAVNPNGRFFGREIALVEPDILADFDTANSGDVIGIYWQPEEYAVNENFAFTMRRYFDEETNEWVNKALVVVDGKILNPTGYYLIKKG
jgi:HK97 family phage major capsid protein